MIGAAIDITARKASEARLRELNENLKRRVSEALAERKGFVDIVAAIDALVQVADLNYRLLAINQASAREFERIFGLRPKVGHSMWNLLRHHPQHQAAVKAVWSRALAGEEFTTVDEFGDASRDRRHDEMKFNSKGVRFGVHAARSSRLRALNESFLYVVRSISRQSLE